MCESVSMLLAKTFIQMRQNIFQVIISDHVSQIRGNLKYTILKSLLIKAQTRGQLALRCQDENKKNPPPQKYFMSSGENMSSPRCIPAALFQPTGN